MSHTRENPAHVSRAQAGASGGPQAAVVERVAWTDPDAVRLRRALAVDIAGRYGDPDYASPERLAQEGDHREVVAMVLVRRRGVALACGALADISGHDDGVGGRHPAGTGEIKRVYVAPEARGTGMSRIVVAALESAARQAGLNRLVLESGAQQPEAMGAYLSMGFDPIEPYGEYAHDPQCRCFGKALTEPDHERVGRAAVRDDARDGATLRGSRPARPAAQSELRFEDVDWNHPEAVARRAEMHTGMSLVLYPSVGELMESRGGYAAADAALGKKAVLSVLAMVGGESVAFGSLARVNVEVGERYPGFLMVRKVVVWSRWRGQGIARRLMAEIEDRGRELGAPGLLLETGIRQVEAVRLYMSLGYRPVAPFGRDINPITLWFAKRFDDTRPGIQ